MNRIAIITRSFLPTTHTFIYEEITAIDQYEIFVLTRERSNETSYPCNNLYVCENKENSVKEFAHIINKNHMRLIHVKFGHNGIHYLALKKLTGLPYVVSFHGKDASSALRDLSTRQKYRYQLFSQVDHIITVSAKLKNNLIKSGCPANKITIIWSGVDLQKFFLCPRTIKPGENVKLLSIGRLTEKKGHTYLIDAFAQVARHNHNIELLIVGDGPLKEKLIKQIDKLHLTTKIMIRESVPFSQIPTLMHQYHIFCLPSVTGADGDEEGIPNVLKEACATGMPVVSTYHSGIPHIIRSGKNGFLVNEKDIDSLSKKILELVNHPERWNIMGAWARNHVEENFDRIKQAKKIEALYSKLIKDQRYKHIRPNLVTNSRNQQ